MTSWILVANADKAFIYDSENLRTKKLHLIKKFSHPESREKGINLVSDKQGRYKTDRQSRGAYSETTDPKEFETETFARELASYLKNSNNDNEYAQLIVVAAPHFYGLLDKHIDFRRDIFSHIVKDYTRLTPKELGEKLYEHLCELK